MQRLTPLLIAVFLMALMMPNGVGQEISDSWKFTLQTPAEGWQRPGFNDSNWSDGFGGFGVRSTPGARVGTTWATDNIWMRKSFELDSIPSKPALLIHHDESAEIFINGQLVITLRGFTQGYEVVPIPSGKHAILRVGKNQMSVHCNQTLGGQFIDVHLVNAEKVPKLPPPRRSLKPFHSELITEWGEQVSAENAWTEYPRPQLSRDSWTNLNGSWDYGITPLDQTDPPEIWTGKILVPYCLESKLGGVQRRLDGTEALWYRRFISSNPQKGKRQLLHFEAVDYRCEVFVNGVSVGKHQGGHTPFSFDITDETIAGANQIVVRVEDETEGWQLRGKQTLDARGIWYTQVSGIWQTVWMEEVTNDFIRDLKISSNADKGTISVQPIVQGAGQVAIRVKDGDHVVAQGITDDSICTLAIPNAKLWSPNSPHLYSLEITLQDDNGMELDQVKSYAGIRTVGKQRDDRGHWRFTLNGKPIFHWGPLDQGWWPDGLLTPPSDEAMLFDIEWLKSAGFNMIRKHIKVEPRRYYYHCDRIGMMVWQDHVSGGREPEWTRLKPNPVDSKWPDHEHQQFMLELERMIAALENHPSIVSWIPFNERWGQHRTVQVGQWTMKRDPSRLVNIASGGNFWPVGDVVDAHSYPQPVFPFEDGKGGRFDNFIKVMGEFGGHGYPVKGHLWAEDRRNWGYGDLPKNEEEYRKRYITSLQALNTLRGQGIAGGVYTQTTDVEGEINGLMTYDRKVVKIPAKELFEMHQILMQNTQ